MADSVFNIAGAVPDAPPIQTYADTEHKYQQNQYLGQINRGLTATNDENERVAKENATIRSLINKHMTVQGNSSPQQEQQPAQVPLSTGPIQQAVPSLFGKTATSTPTPANSPQLFGPLKTDNTGAVSGNLSNISGGASLPSVGPKGLSAPFLQPSGTAQPTIQPKVPMKDPVIGPYDGHNTVANPNTASGHAGVQVSMSNGPNGQQVKTTFNREGFLQDLQEQGLGYKIPEYRDAFRKADADSLAYDAQEKQAEVARVMGKFYGIRLLPESDDNVNGQRAKAWTAEWDAENRENPANTKGIPRNYPGDDVFERMNDQLLDAKDRVSDQLRAAKEAQDDATKRWLGERNSNANLERAQAALMNAETNRLKEEKAASGDLGGQYSGLMGQELRTELQKTPQGNIIFEKLRAIATGDFPVNTRSKEGQALAAQANQAFPGLNINGMQKWKADMGKTNAGTSGGVQVGAIKTHEHIDAMLASDAAASGVGGPGFIAQPLNAMGNIRTKAGNAAKAWEAEHKAVVTEIARTFKGGPSGQMDTVNDMKNLKFSDSPERKRTVYKAYSDLMAGQTSGVEAERQANLGEADPGTSILNVKAQKTMIKLNPEHTLPVGTLPAFDANPLNTPIGGLMPFTADKNPSATKTTAGTNPRYKDAVWISGDKTGKRGGWFRASDTGMLRVE